jgi:hypothetical protein
LGAWTDGHAADRAALSPDDHLFLGQRCGKGSPTSFGQEKAINSRGVTINAFGGSPRDRDKCQGALGG